MEGPAARAPGQAKRSRALPPRKTKSTMRQARAGITGLSPTDKVAKALLVETKMTGNPDFATPEPTLLELKAGREALETAITEAAGGDHAKVFARQLAEAALDDLLVRMAMYVSNKAAGDELKILSTGFELRKLPEPIGPLSAPIDLEARTGALPGSIDLRCKPVKGAYYYQVFVNATDPEVEASWTLLALTARASNEALLEPARHYWFRMNALGAAGASPFSDPAKGFSAPLP